MVLIQVAQLLLSLSFLVVLHELGHFIPAKIFGCRVNSFYLFFNPKFSLFKKKIGETEYGIGWLPLGGYVKIAGMVDESMDTDSLSKEPEPWEFRSKPAWQRLIIMLGGVFVNIVLAILIFGFTTFFWGTDQLPIDQVNVHGVYASEYAEKVGFKTGDKLYKVGANKVEYYNDFMLDIMLKEPKDVTVIRDNKKIIIPIEKSFIKAMVKARKVGLISPRVKFVVESVSKNSGANKAGLKGDDYVVGVNELKIKYYDEMFGFLDSLKGTTVKVKVLRLGIPVVKNVTLDKESKMGVSLRPPFNFEHVDYNSLGTAFSVGITNSWNLLRIQLKSMAWMFDSEIQGYKGVGGVISMTQIFAPVWDWHSFWSMTATLSVMLAFMNVLPIPALDGGHALFLMYEIIFRRKPSQKFLEKAQVIGMILLLTLMVLANGNDIINAITK